MTTVTIQNTASDSVISLYLVMLCLVQPS